MGECTLGNFSKFMFLLCFAKIGTVVAISRIFQKLLFPQKIYFIQNVMSHQFRSKNSEMVAI